MKTVELFIKAVNALLNENFTQSMLADSLCISRPHMNNFLKGRRNFSETKRELIAQAFGKTYVEMLNYGLTLIDGKKREVEISQQPNINDLPNTDNQICSIQDELLKKHVNIITKFENKELATQINESLIRLEKLGGSNSLEDLKEYIDFKIKKEEEKKCTDSPNGTTGMGQ